MPKPPKKEESTPVTATPQKKISGDELREKHQARGPIFSGTVMTDKRPGTEHEEALRKAAQELRKRAKKG